MISMQGLQSSAKSLETKIKPQSNVDSTTNDKAKTLTEEETVIYETAANKQKITQYKPDLEKIKKMKDESDLRMLDLFKQTMSGGFLKQAGSLKRALESILNGEKFEGMNTSITPESIEKAKESIAEGGYYSAEATSDRFLDFAKALSGGDKSKADQLMDAFKKGYEEAENIWGGKLPEISQKTYDMTLEKFESWANEAE